jgi:hypothetical protein
MTAETHPMTGFTDTGETPHSVARLHPHTACCGQPLVYIPTRQEPIALDRVCRACRNSGVTPLPHDHDPTEDTA